MDENFLDMIQQRLIELNVFTAVHLDGLSVLAMYQMNALLEELNSWGTLSVNDDLSYQLTIFKDDIQYIIKSDMVVEVPMNQKG